MFSRVTLSASMACFLALASIQQLLRVVDLIIHLVEAVVEVGFAVLVVAVVRVELIDLLHQFILDGVLLPELLFQMRDFLL